METMRTFLALGLALLTLPNIAAAEELRLATMYPSPRGVYASLRATNNALLALEGGGVAIGTRVQQDPAGEPRLLVVAGPGQNPVSGACPAGTQHFDENASGGAPEAGECKVAWLHISLNPAQGPRVGIGTASPQAPLHLVASAPGTEALAIQARPGDPNAFVITAESDIALGKQTYSPPPPPPTKPHGNLDVNDVYLRSTGRYLSQGVSPSCRLMAPPCAAGDILIAGGGNCKTKTSRPTYDAATNQWGWQMESVNGGSCSPEVTCCRWPQ